MISATPERLVQLRAIRAQARLRKMQRQITTQTPPVRTLPITLPTPQPAGRLVETLPTTAQTVRIIGEWI